MLCALYSSALLQRNMSNWFRFHFVTVNYDIKRRNQINLSWSSCRSSILVELEIGNVGFCEGGKTGEPGEKHLQQGMSQQQTQATYSTRLELNLGHIGGRWALSSLCYSCPHRNFAIYLLSWKIKIRCVNSE